MQHRRNRNGRSSAACARCVLRALAVIAIAVLAAACGRAPGGLVFVDRLRRWIGRRLRRLRSH